ncbi:Tim44 domain-containing protein [Agrobacterium sp. a22-2]|uniref:Tim44 domain-containing protein n=1 Tax=Agrobacterium sp. a22-2 TaxID=2283840 RepID=UPI001446EA45|nr:Tim44 domain-containing protein [Agrobacterium sp. a22-2]NKN35594.1 Tim44 domain-containing protein [Agrobacterium sp. a22-2]
MRSISKYLGILAVGLMVSIATTDMAEARKAGGFSGFGSRGTKTFSAPPTTRTAPAPAAPIERSMTPKTNATQPNATPANQQRPGFFGGLGGSMLGGLMMGGLIGMLLGGGMGGGIGFLGLIFQVILIAVLASLAMRFFRSRQQAAHSTPNGGLPPQGNKAPGFEIPRMGALLGGSKPVSADEIGIQKQDLDTFESILKDVQAAYAAEDYSALRRLTTPEAMSYLAEELSDNATKGLRNEVRDVHLVQGDVAESWREGTVDYATIAMRYEAIDVMRDRTTGAVISGDPDNASDSVEIWTFVRRPGAGWQVSAIQGAEAA